MTQPTCRALCSRRVPDCRGFVVLRLRGTLLSIFWIYSLEKEQ